MFGLFRKRSQVQQRIAEEGFEHAADHFSGIVAEKITSRDMAYLFVLQELDAAAQGNAASQRFAMHSGILPSEFKGALSAEYSAIDGPEGAQQLLCGLTMDLAHKPELMAQFRCAIVDKIMKEYGLGRYGSREDRVEELLRSLKAVLLSDRNVLATLAPDIPVSAEIPVRHAHFSVRNIASAREILIELSRVSGGGQRRWIDMALQA